jgi:hypothetical protein
MSEEQTKLIRRFTAEHAWRLLFAKEPDADIQRLRIRTVSREAVKQEHQLWKTWHEQQTTAEKEFAD